MSCENLSSCKDISAEDIAKLCFNKFKNLPKTGKPNNKEWTILAGIVLHNKLTGKSEVISLGCGTKCIGKSKLCPQGLIINDSHAEILARRGLMRYMYHQMKRSIKSDVDNDNIFEWESERQKFKFRNELSLHFLSTQTPCGDACIIEKDLKEPLVKRCKVEETTIKDENAVFVGDGIYTGAKLVGSQHRDPMEQRIGAVRTKPGRGERTLSMSCSDKLAKWQIMGVQGALLNFLLSAPLYFNTLNFWGENNIETLERAIWKRFNGNDLKDSKYSLHIPKVRTCKKPQFAYAQDSTKQPSPNGLVWCNVPEDMKPYEISVNGKRQGITLKNLQSPESALKISKYFLFKEFINILKLKPKLITSEENLESNTYLDCKLFAEDYISAWSDVKLNYFKQWSKKPDNVLKFSINEVEKKDKIEN